MLRNRRGVAVNHLTKTVRLSSFVLLAALSAGAQVTPDAPVKGSAQSTPKSPGAASGPSNAAGQATSSTGGTPPGSASPLSKATVEGMPNVPIVPVKDRTSWIMPIFKTTTAVNKQITTTVH